MDSPGRLARTFSFAALDACVESWLQANAPHPATVKTANLTNVFMVTPVQVRARPTRALRIHPGVHYPCRLRPGIALATIRRMKSLPVPVAQARQNMADVLQTAQQGGRIRLTRHGKPVGWIIGEKDRNRLRTTQDGVAKRRRPR